MPTAAQVLGKFSAELAFEDIPPAVVERAKDCIIDTLAVAAFGSQLPWSRTAANYAKRYGGSGPCSLVGFPGTRVQAPYAALANGTFAAACEQDNTFDPGVGVHPGASLVPAVLAACEEANVDGKTAIIAVVAGCEVLFRIGGASFYSAEAPETFGFHLPALTGPYGAAVAAGRAFGLDAEQLCSALGIAGSLSSGLKACTHSQQGGMVKCLHMGRTAESGMLAARFASDGFTGPETVLEGRSGFLEAYCRGPDTQRLTAGLGEVWGTLRINMKRYSCHMSPQTAMQSLRELMSEHAFRPDDVAKITVEVTDYIFDHNNVIEPGDMMQAQFSVPFCVALAMYQDPDDPKSFDEKYLNDAAIRNACRSLVELRAFPAGKRSAKSSRVTVRLKNGKEYVREANSFKGMPDSPLSRTELQHRFMMQAAAMGEANAARIYERLANLEAQPRFSLQ